MRVSRPATPSSRGLGHGSPVSSAVSWSPATARCIGAHSAIESITLSGALNPASHELAHTARLALGELTTSKHRSAWRRALGRGGGYRCRP
ncbi:hypothetical protein E5720_00415 [Rhodococcus sp. PAMC28707]|nr:hypothetical protein E5769_13600 [Rhodococcus sp. PAMC28705]QCB57199.1 hypothetical protein E5720_00415 [Rhodococcus sp. PAMC28707]